MPILIDVYAEDLFAVYIDDYIESNITLDVMQTFLHTSYFPRVPFAPVYLLSEKIKVFMDILEFLGSKGSRGRLRPSAQYCNKIGQMLFFISQEKLDAFL